MFGICNLSMVPCRIQPSDKSEMVTQLLFGEHFRILEEQEKWVRIKIAFDGYECWIDKKQFKKISEEEFNFLNNESQRLSVEFLRNIKNRSDKSSITLLMGSILPRLKKGIFSIGNENYQFRGKSVLSSRKTNRANIVRTAKLYLNSPYLWGGRSPLGIDCSGFTQMVFRLNGFRLHRDAYQQAEIGEPLNFVEEAQRGDLAFFDNEEGKIVHVGIISDKNQVIHSSGKVRMDVLDHYGIFNIETGKYSHNLRVIKRLL